MFVYVYAYMYIYICIYIYSTCLYNMFIHMYMYICVSVYGYMLASAYSATQSNSPPFPQNHRDAEPGQASLAFPRLPFSKGHEATFTLAPRGSFCWPFQPQKKLGPSGFSSYSKSRKLQFLWDTNEDLKTLDELY